MKNEYESIKAYVTELLLCNSMDYKESITKSTKDSASLNIRRYLRKLANVKGSIYIKFIPNSVKAPTAEGTIGCGSRWNYRSSTRRLEVGEHWFLNHFGIREYKQYEDFDGWAKREPLNRDKFIKFTFNKPEVITDWLQVKLTVVK